jgi:uncharacterized iron-regulated membrane protein
MTQAFWRRWHRWVGFVGALFLIFAAVSGVLVAISEVFGEAEAIREATRDLVSPVTTASPQTSWQEPVLRALRTAAREAPGAPIDRLAVAFKGDQPIIDVFLGRPGGGEDRRLVIDASSGRLLRVEPYVDKPVLHRIHSGEFFGDGGLVFAMLWGTGLAFLGVSGLVIYFAMRRRNPTGLQKVFW